MKNFYEILGVRPDATQDEIKSRFRELSKEYHPDLNPNVDPNRIKDINNAYSVLSDTKKRRKYDSSFSRNNNFKTKRNEDFNSKEMLYVLKNMPYRDVINYIAIAYEVNEHFGQKVMGLMNKNIEEITNRCVKIANFYDLILIMEIQHKRITTEFRSALEKKALNLFKDLKLEEKRNYLNLVEKYNLSEAFKM